MRMELCFELEQPKLPADNKKIWISFLKNCVSHCNNGIYYERYFSSTRKKDYTFSIILSAPKFSGETIFLENRQVKMIFSADDRNKTGLIFGQALIGAKQKRFPLPDGNAITLKRINYLREHLITSSRVMFRTIVGGGLVVREHIRETNKDKFWVFNEDGFEKQLQQVLAIQAEEAGFSVEAGTRIKFKPIQCKKVLVKQYGIYVDCTIGIFELEGEPDFLQYLYQAGFGSKHSMGYGLLDIVAQKREE